MALQFYDTPKQWTFNASISRQVDGSSPSWPTNFMIPQSSGLLMHRQVDDSSPSWPSTSELNSILNHNEAINCRRDFSCAREPKRPQASGSRQPLKEAFNTSRPTTFKLKVVCTVCTLIQIKSSIIQNQLTPMISLLTFDIFTCTKCTLLAA